MTQRREFMFAMAALAAGFAQAAAAPDRKGLDAIGPRMQAFVDAGTIAGAVTLVQHKGKLVHLAATGWRDMTQRAPMTADTVFQVMSQSKPFIATAVGLLLDEGKLKIDDPVDAYLPEFGDPWLIVRAGPAERVLARPSRKITIGDVLSHSSGLPDAAPVTHPFAVKMRYSLAEVVAVLSQQPLEAEPGARWRYSNQGIAVAARIVEVVAGRPYEDFVEQRIFGPLGMKASCYRPAPEVWPRIAADYELHDGRLREMGPGTPGYGALKLRQGTRYQLPEAGIFSTAEDMARFHQMFLDGGRWDGAQFLSQQAVATLLTPRIAIPAERGMGGTAQALGWRIQTAADNGLAAGTIHHSGAFGSFGWADPQRGIVGMMLLQRPAAVAERKAMTNLVAAACEKGEFS